MTRLLVSSGSPFEGQIGFSRAVRVGNAIEIAGTAPIGAEDGDMYAQTKRCIEIVETALQGAGAELKHVTRTRILVTDMALWREAARAHGEAFADIRPVTTVMQVSGFIDPRWVVELEASAVLD